MEEKITLQNTDFVLRWLVGLSIALNLLLLLSSVFVVTEATGVEDNVIYTLQTILADNRLLYTNPEEAPYAITQYAPLHYIICDAVLSLLGLEPDSNPYLIKLVGRLVSVVFVGFCVYVLRKIFRDQIGLAKQETHVLLLTFVSFTAPWFYIARPDVLIGFFTILAVYYVFSYLNNRQGKAAFIAGVVCFLALFSKQSGAFLIGSVGLFLLLSRDVKGTALFTAGVVVASLAGYLIMELFNYNTTYLYANIVKGIDNGTSFVSFIRVMNTVVLKYGFIILLTITGSIVLFRSRLAATERFALYLFYFFLLLALVISFKIGSSENYFLDSLMAGLLLCGFFIRKFLYQDARLVLKKWSLLFLVMATLHIAVVHVLHFGFHNAYDWYFYLRNREDYRKVEVLIEEELKDGLYYYTEDVHIQLMNPKRMIFPATDVVTCCAYPLGTFSYQSFQQDVINGKLKFIISFKPTTQEIYGVVNGKMFGVEVGKHFRPYKAIGGIKIYKNIHTN